MYPEIQFNIVLIEPEIPQNTGNIGRTCVGTWCKLHLVGKLGFEITDKNLKRSGLDYWPHLEWVHHPDWESWWKLVQNPTRVFFFSTHADKNFYDLKLQKGDWLVFGKETKGLGPEIIKKYRDQLVKLPMLGPIRSLNVATTVAIAAYEGLRQFRTVDNAH